MRLAFYYHIPITSTSDGIKIPSYLGVFINALAKEVEQLVLIMHEAYGNEIGHCDYLVEAKNITWINLGKKTPAWHRALFHKKLLKNKLRDLKADYFLVRSPSPLAPYFHYYFPQDKIRFLIVGDYESSLESSPNKTLRELAVNYYLKYNSYLFKKAIRKTKILVNSPVLFDKYNDIASSCKLVVTTTLSNQDFFKREDTCTGDVIKLLYTGRIDLQKGLLELITATGELINEGFPVELHLVGWEEKSEKPIENLLKSKANEMGILEKVFFHGKKTVGEELNQFYRMADIYVIPSYHEGFPRTIWEAMANSLPIICTKVGGIPFILEDCINTIFVEKKSSKSLIDGIIKVIESPVLRRKIILNNNLLVVEKTIENSVKSIVSNIEK